MREMLWRSSALWNCWIISELACRVLILGDKSSVPSWTDSDCWHEGLSSCKERIPSLFPGGGCKPGCWSTSLLKAGSGTCFLRFLVRGLGVEWIDDSIYRILLERSNVHTRFVSDSLKG